MESEAPTRARDRARHPASVAFSRRIHLALDAEANLSDAFARSAESACALPNLTGSRYRRRVVKLLLLVKLGKTENV